MRDDWWFFKVLVPALAVFTLFYGLQDVRPAYAALFRGGELGSFTARNEECGKTCSWRGDFVSDNGATVRRNVRLAPGGDVDHAGDRVRARDTGNRVVVYPAAWSWDWLFLTMLLAVSVVVLSVWTRWAWRRLRRRGAGPAPPDGDSST
ncbi:hypothetical protein [Spirillospora albida]|uniref:hypothetical protein n=1 Tax=Spirillospora albida TaxID=58123 RepID=UPI0004BF8BAA|nr:hypothetical protein [Spirillospora albida]